jgi:glycosyltransferase involved in cell wall biosynthesis
VPYGPVAIDTTPLLGARAGIGRFVDELLAGLARLDDAPDVVRYVLSARGALDDGVRRLPIPAALALRVWGHADWPAYDRALAPARVVHGTNFVVPPMRGAARVITVHDCFMFRHPEQCRPAVRALARPVRHAVARGAWVHAVSQFTGDEVRALLGTDRVTVVPSGVSALPAPGRLPPAVVEPYALAIGTHEPRKRLVWLARMFAAEVAPVTGARLVIAGGPGPDTGRLEALARDQDAITVLGYVDEPTRAALLAHASVLAHASEYEGFGLTVLEAMQTGAPVVAVAAAAVTEVAGDTAVLGEPAALAAALVDVLTDEARRADLAARGRRRAQSFSWDATARGLDELYRSLA